MKPYFLIPLFFQKLIWIPTRLILTIFGHIKISGFENLKGLNGSVIFACNHSSEIDPFIVPASLPFWSRFSPLFYVVREKFFYERNGWRRHLFNSLFINAWGGYAAQVGLYDYEQSLFKHIAIAFDGGSFCVYPEGGITCDGNIQPAKGGVTYLAQRANCTIVPVGVSGVYKTSVSDFFMRKRHINVSFGKPISQKDLNIVIPQVPEFDVEICKNQANYIMKKVGELMVS